MRFYVTLPLGYDKVGQKVDKLASIPDVVAADEGEFITRVKWSSSKII